jgi:RNA recognition motif-containing protein
MRHVSCIMLITRYGEVVDINLVRDKKTGKSKGFAFLAYEDQRSTNLAVDNLNGATVNFQKIFPDEYCLMSNVGIRKDTAGRSCNSLSTTSTRRR